MSSCVRESQAVGEAGAHVRSDRSMAFAVTSRWRMHATKATFAGLLLARIRR